MKTEQEFQYFYETNLSPMLGGLELDRKKVAKQFWLFLFAEIFLIGISVLFFYTELLLFTQTIMIIALIVFVAYNIIFAIVHNISASKFRKRYKYSVVQPILLFMNDGLTFEPKGKIAQDEYMNSKIFLTRPDKYSGEDLVLGKVGSTAIKFSELHTQYKTQTHSSKGGTKTQWHTIFRGVFFIADFNKNFNGTTVVLPDISERIFGWLGTKLQQLNFIRGGKLIKLEDPEFEKQFAVYGDDEVEARYLLSTSLMQRILDFKKKSGKTIGLSFTNSKLNIAITIYKNLFEARIFKKISDYKFIKETYNYFALFLAIVEDLDLNTRIWTKE